MKCENCDKEHDGSYGSGRFCCFEWAYARFDGKNSERSYACRRAWSSLKLGKELNGENYRLAA